MFAQALDTQAALEFAADVRHYLSKTQKTAKCILPNVYVES